MTDPEADPLCHSVSTILIQCHRDRQGDGIFLPTVEHGELTAFAGIMARRLGAAIGGRYVPKPDLRAERDRGVWGAFNGKNRDEVMRRFKISRALFYSIIARQPRR